MTDLDAPLAGRMLANAGGQLDVRLSALSVLELTLSVGGNIAIEAGAPRGAS